MKKSLQEIRDSRTTRSYSSASVGLIAEVARTPREIHAVQHFRYQVLKDAGRASDQPCLDHERQRHRDPLDRRLLVFYVRDGERIVGTVRWGLSNWTAGIDPHPDQILNTSAFFRQAPESRVGRTDRLVIAPGAPGRFAIPILFGIGMKIAIDAGCEHDICWCAPPFASLYRRLGYEPIGLQMQADDGRSLESLRLDLRQVDAIARRRPVLARAINHRAVA